MNIPNSLTSAYQPRKKRLKSCNNKCTLGIPSLDGYSYGYWQVVKVIDGVVVFNNYSYSNTTSGHQWQLRSWLETLGVKIDLEVECPNGLQRLEWTREAIEHDAYTIGTLRAKMRHGTKDKNVSRQLRIDSLLTRITRISKVEYVSGKTIRDILRNSEISAGMSYESDRDRKAKDRYEKKIRKVTNALLSGIL